MLGVAPYPTSVASTRLRLLPVLRELEGRGHEVVFESFLDDIEMPQWFGTTGQRARVLGAALMRFTARLVKSDAPDLLLIQREALPLNWLSLERKFGSAKKIWDIDDACWNDAGWPKSMIRGSAPKFAQLATLVDETWAGSTFTAASARVFGSPEVHPVPTCAPDNVSIEFKRAEKLAVWVGTPSTAPFIHPIVQNIAPRNPDWTFVILGGEAPVTTSPNVIYRRWTLSSESDLLSRARVALYPLPIGDGSIQGKSGFRANLYRSFGVPVIANSDASTCEVMGDPWVGGVRADSPREWREAFSRFNDVNFAAVMGEAGYSHVRNHYSLTGWSRALADRCERLVLGVTT